MDSCVCVCVWARATETACACVCARACVLVRMRAHHTIISVTRSHHTPSLLPSLRLFCARRRQVLLDSCDQAVPQKI